MLCPKPWILTSSLPVLRFPAHLLQQSNPTSAQLAPQSTNDPAFPPSCPDCRPRSPPWQLRAHNPSLPSPPRPSRWGLLAQPSLGAAQIHPLAYNKKRQQQKKAVTSGLILNLWGSSALLTTTPISPVDILSHILLLHVHLFTPAFQTGLLFTE